MSDQSMEDSSSEDWALMCDRLYFLFATEFELTILVRGLSKMRYLPNPGIRKLHGQLGMIYFFSFGGIRLSGVVLA